LGLSGVGLPQVASVILSSINDLTCDLALLR